MIGYSQMSGMKKAPPVSRRGFFMVELFR